MVRVNARYQKGQLVLEQPLDLPEGSEVVVDICAVDPTFNANLDGLEPFGDEQTEQQAWELACSRLEEELDLADASYDDWRKVYSVSHHSQPVD